jgi:hypothetical protein
MRRPPNDMGHGVRVLQPRMTAWDGRRWNGYTERLVVALSLGQP